MKIGLFFGSFNPIHHGHLMVASFIANHTDLQQIWLVVSPQNPHKTQSSLLNEYDRLYLAQLAIEDDTQIKVSDIEFKLPKPSYTIDTLTYLQEKYPQHQFMSSWEVIVFKIYQNGRTLKPLLKIINS
jgi:nicotinate-nucleotide adenylyltransferase